MNAFPQLRIQTKCFGSTYKNEVCNSLSKLFLNLEMTSKRYCLAVTKLRKQECILESSRVFKPLGYLVSYFYHTAQEKFIMSNK